MRTRGFFARLVIAAVISWVFYGAVDYFAVHNWNDTDSLIVRVIEAGPESVIPPEDEEEESYEMLERETVLQVLSGNRVDEVMTVKTVRLSGSGLEVIRGRRYLLVWDMFSDGRTQYSIADAYRVPAIAGIVMMVCAVLIALTGFRGLFALLGLAASIAVLVFTMIPLTVRGWDCVWLAIASVFIISTVTVLCVVRHARYRLVALMGSLGGVLCGFLCGAAMVYLWGLNGLAGEGAALLASTLPGLNVGSEVLGSMINTLILAYMGSALPMAVLISSAGIELSGLLNDPYIAQEIVQSLAGTLGLLFTIPAASFSFVIQESMLRKARDGHSS